VIRLRVEENHLSVAPAILTRGLMWGLPDKRLGAERLAPRWRRLWRAAIVVLLCGPGLLFAQTLSLSFDDGFDLESTPDAAALNAQLLAGLKEAGVRSMLFPAGKFVDSPGGLAPVRAWGDAGHAIGNHTYSHRNFGSGRRSVAEFGADVLQAEAVLRSVTGYQKRLRFPYLKEGDSAARRDALRAWMREHGYANGPVSIDTSDWYYNERFIAWRRDKPASEWARFAEPYIRHLIDRADYYDALALRVLGRRPRHVMLLHTNALNAAFLPRIVRALRERGWTLVDTAEAFADPLYASQPKTVPAGESIVWSLAKEAGVQGLRYPAEDSVYEAPGLDAAGY
jgi:peptidoglycan/xylan/chitin deacetylase (PgdA/CDA1 family)